MTCLFFLEGGGQKQRLLQKRLWEGLLDDCWNIYDIYIYIYLYISTLYTLSLRTSQILRCDGIPCELTTSRPWANLTELSVQFGYRGVTERGTCPEVECWYQVAILDLDAHFGAAQISAYTWWIAVTTSANRAWNYGLVGEDGHDFYFWRTLIHDDVWSCLIMCWTYCDRVYDGMLGESTGLGEDGTAWHFYEDGLASIFIKPLR